MTTLVHCAPSGTFVYDSHVRVLFAEVINDISNVTREEFDYAVDTTDLFCLTGINGWEVMSEIITDPTWKPFNRQRPGSLTVETAQLLYAADRRGQDIRLLMHRGVRGYVLILPAGEIDGGIMNVYPVWVAKTTQLQRLQNNGAQIMVNCSVPSQPAEDVSIPAEV